MSAPLAEHFDAEDQGTEWHLFCKKCERGWVLKKPARGAEVLPGNLLHLLNHAMGCKGRKRGGDE